jgi:hypothetical protein
MLVAKVRETLSVSKLTMQKSEMEGFNHNKLNDPEVKVQYRVKTQTGLQLWKPSVIM